MIKLKLIPILFVFYLLISCFPAQAETQFETHMNTFYTKQEIASKLLKDIEKDLKDGSIERLCARQRKASNYGIEATESLIQAFEVNGTPYNSDDMKAVLNKWRDLKRNC